MLRSMQSWYSCAILIGVVVCVAADLPIHEECTSVLSGSSHGDPHFVGFRGQRFDFHGKPWTVFTLLTMKSMTMNALFVPSSDWTEGFTVMNSIGLRISNISSEEGELNIVVACSNANNARISVSLNDNVLKTNEVHTYGGPTEHIAVSTTSKDVMIASSSWTVSIQATRTRNLGCFLNTETEIVKANVEDRADTPGGLLGSTLYLSEEELANAFSDEMEFQVEGNDLLAAGYTKPHSTVQQNRRGLRHLNSVAGSATIVHEYAHSTHGGVRTLLQTDPSAGCGCADSDALNFDSSATLNDGTCVYATTSGSEVQVRVDGNTTSFDLVGFVDETAAAMNVSADRIDVTNVQPGSVIVTMFVDEAYPEYGEAAEPSSTDAIYNLLSKGASAYLSFSLLEAQRIRSSDGVWWRQSRSLSTGTSGASGGVLLNPCRPTNPCSPGVCIGVTAVDLRCICPEGYIEGPSGGCMEASGPSPQLDTVFWTRDGPQFGGPMCNDATGGKSPTTEVENMGLCAFDLMNTYEHCNQFDNHTFSGTITPQETMLAHMYRARLREECQSPTGARRRSLMGATPKPGKEGAWTSWFCQVFCKSEMHMNTNLYCQDNCDLTDPEDWLQQNDPSDDLIATGTLAKQLLESYPDSVVIHPPQTSGDPHIHDAGGARFSHFQEGDYLYFAMALNEQGSRRVEFWQRQVYFHGKPFAGSAGVLVNLVDEDSGYQTRLSVQAITSESGTQQWIAFNECDEAQWYRRAEPGMEYSTVTDFNGIPHVTLETDVTNPDYAFLSLGQGVVFVLSSWAKESTPNGMNVMEFVFDDTEFVAVDGIWGGYGDYSILGFRTGNETEANWAPALDDSGLFPTCVWDDRGIVFDSSGMADVPDNTTLEDVCTQAEIESAEACCLTIVTNTSDAFVWDACVFDACVSQDCSGTVDGYNTTLNFVQFAPTTNFTALREDILTGTGSSTGTGEPSGGSSHPGNWVTDGGVPVDCSSDAAICAAYDNTMCISDGNGNTVCMCSAGSEYWNAALQQCDTVTARR